MWTQILNMVEDFFSNWMRMLPTDAQTWLKSWSTVGGNACEGSGGVDLLEEACHWVWAFRFQMPRPFPVSPCPHPHPLSFCLLLVDQGENLNHCSSVCLPLLPCFPWWSWILWPSGTGSHQIKCFYKLPWSWCLFTAREKQLKQKLVPGSSILLW